MPRTNVQSDLHIYMKQINEVALLTPEEEKDLGWRIINDDDQEAKERMIKANLRLVIAIGKNYSHRGLTLADLKQIILAGFKSAFLPFHVKQAYLRKASEELALFQDSDFPTAAHSGALM